MFLDEVTISVRSGDGGDGCVSFRREKFVPRGGPDGGRGGRGGHVILEASRSLTTLLDLSRRRSYAAENGRPGGPANCTGRTGRDVIVRVPVGTIVRSIAEDAEDPSSAEILGDLVEHGQSLLVGRGGRGGRGNKSFASSTHQVPRIAREGQPGEERRLYLELKLLADVGLVGLPNAGKSTLLARVSAATPKVAAYPFTTLQPQLGIAEVGDYRRIVVADIPGLIEGAHEGHGLGIEFLRHIERTRVLVHLVSLEAESIESLERDYTTVRRELESYSEALHRKPFIVVVTKTDLLPPDEAEVRRRTFSERLGRPVLAMSAVTGVGVDDVLASAVEILDEVVSADPSSSHSGDE